MNLGGMYDIVKFILYDVFDYSQYAKSILSCTQFTLLFTVIELFAFEERRLRCASNSISFSVLRDC